MANVEVTLELVELDNTPGISSGENFQVNVFFEDILNGQAVVSGYTDVLFDPDAIAVNAITFAPDYDTLQTGSIDNNAGLVDEVGALTSNAASGTVPDNNLVFTLDVTALIDLTDSATTITTEAPDENFSEITILGSDDIQNSETDFGSLTIERISTFFVFGTTGDDSDLTTNLELPEGTNALVFAGGGADFIDSIPSGDRDRIDTGSGTDEIIVGTGDRIFGGAGDDTLDARTGGGNNRLYGMAGNDALLANTSDSLFGGAGDDTLDAREGSGDNKLYGQEDNDTFLLGAGDRVFGGTGADAFFAGSGEGNAIAGGADADQFWIINDELPVGVNTIVDFEAGVDVIGIDGDFGAELDAFDDLDINAAGGVTTIAALGQDVAVLEGDFTLVETDFVFLVG